MRTESISVVVMTYDEVENLEAVVRELIEALQGLPLEADVLIVDDGSRDGSGELADRLAAELPAVRVVHHGDNRALGGVYRTGFAEARGDVVTFLPADGQFPADTIALFVEEIDDCHMVLGYLPDRKSSAVAKLLSAAERQVYTLLLGPLPTFQGMMMFRRELLDEVVLESQGRGWAIVWELILKVDRGPYRVKSVPTKLRPRMSGHSKVNNLPTILANLKQVVGLRDLIPRKRQ
ncbi:MAG: glycosyltransferase family 2 protein [Myxococcales bacterium]|nr:glycosyltransferase family 2 protein [Myxococcales bacterium]